MKLHILEPAMAAVEEHARAAYPEECCGLLIGELPEDFGAPGCALQAAESRRLANAWEGSKERRYGIDPLVFAKTERELAAEKRGVLGIYHSHPDVAAWPSPFDLDRAWPSYAYLIVSVIEGKIRDARVWRLSEDRRGFEEGALKRVRESCFVKLRS